MVCRDAGAVWTYGANLSYNGTVGPRNEDLNWYKDPACSTDHESAAYLAGGTGGNHLHGCAVRGSGQDGFCCMAYPYYNKSRIYKFNGGTQTKLSDGGSGAINKAWKASANGTTIAWHYSTGAAWVLSRSVVNSSFPANKGLGVGIIHHSTTQIKTWDNWKGDDYGNIAAY